MQRMCDSVIPVKNDTFVATLAPIILSSDHSEVQSDHWINLDVPSTQYTSCLSYAENLPNCPDRFS